MFERITRWQSVIFFVLSAIGSPWLVCTKTYAADKKVLEPMYLHEDGGVVYDKNAGLVWIRCPIGEVWKDGGCVGTAEKLSFSVLDSRIEAFNQSKFQGYSDWRLPTIEELHTLKVCTHGHVDEKEDGHTFSRKCTNDSKAPAINLEIFPSWAKLGFPMYGRVWSSTKLNTKFVWTMDRDGDENYKYIFGMEYVGSRSPSYEEFIVVLVRSVLPSDADLVAKFNLKIDSKLRLEERTTLQRRILEEQRGKQEAKEIRARYDACQNKFRARLVPGMDTASGTIIEIKGTLIKVQTNESQCSQRNYEGACVNYIKSSAEKWFKRADIYSDDC